FICDLTNKTLTQMVKFMDVKQACIETEKDIQKATARFEQMNEEAKEKLFRNMMLGLPGSDDAFTPEQVLTALKNYEGINAQKLKAHLFYFLKQVVPVAEACGLKMAIHPDDPPYPVLGLPRVVSTEQDALDIINSVPSVANGLCFCSGSYGARADNNLVSMIQRFSDNLHFLHLRNTKRDSEGNFYEADHLGGDTDMYAIVKEVVLMMKRRNISIPMRPDHGHQMLDDLKKKQDDLKKSLEDARKQVSRGFQELGVNFRLRLGGETFVKLKPIDLVRCLDSSKSIFLLKFNLRDTNKDNTAWLTLLKNSPMDSMACDVMLSYPSPDGHESTLAPATPFLIRIPLFRWPFWVSFAIIGGCLLVFVKNISTTEILRDPGITLLNRDAGSKSYWHQHAHPLSMARLQMSIWFFVIITAFVFLWSTTGSLAGVNATAFALMGISGGTTVISALISQKQEWLASERAPNAPTSGALTNWLIDLLSDEKGITIHRFQMLAWTLVLAVVFVNGVIIEYAMPVFTKELLGLMGISSGVYVGFKLKEGNVAAEETDSAPAVAKKKAVKTEGGAA
ncbi:MAG: mannonate dehydratase, partial [Prosthecobacter sp.]